VYDIPARGQGCPFFNERVENAASTVKGHNNLIKEMKMIAPVNEQPEDQNDVRYIIVRDGRSYERDRAGSIYELVELMRELLEQDHSFELSRLMTALAEVPDDELEDTYLEAGRSALGKHAEIPVVERDAMLQRIEATIDWSLRLQREVSVDEYLSKLSLSGHEKLVEEYNRQLGSSGMMMIEKS